MLCDSMAHPSPVPPAVNQPILTDPLGSSKARENEEGEMCVRGWLRVRSVRHPRRNLGCRTPWRCAILPQTVVRFRELRKNSRRADFDSEPQPSSKSTLASQRTTRHRVCIKKRNLSRTLFVEEVSESRMPGRVRSGGFEFCPCVGSSRQYVGGFDHGFANRDRSCESERPPVSGERRRRQCRDSCSCHGANHGVSGSNVPQAERS